MHEYQIKLCYLGLKYTKLRYHGLKDEGLVRIATARLELTVDSIRA
jgi:hypothetical protein